MSQSIFELSAQSANSANLAGVDGSTRICRVGVIELQDSFTPSCPNALPSPSQMRAMRTEVVTTSGTSGFSTAQPSAPLRFHTSMWDALGAKASAPVVEPPQAKTTPAPTPPPLPPPKPAGFSTDLWYAQAASRELHQKKEQLSHRPLRPAPIAVNQ